jgi:hypothetical protein
MRFLAALAMGAVVLAAAAPRARAHGGCFGHARRGPVQAPSIACDCARAECETCSAPGLAEGRDLSKREVRLETVKRWGDLEQVRVTVTFETKVERTFLEAHARIERPPVLAVTAGTVTCVEADLTGIRAPDERARRDYLWERDRRLRDPMLVRAEGIGAVSVRVFPVSTRAPMIARLDAFTLAEPAGTAGPRLYRTSDRFLAVVPRTPENERDADFVDAAGGRALFFLTEAQARVRHADLVAAAVEVPCLDALRDAIRGRGDAAVTADTSLVALPKGSRAPDDLFVGPAEKAPLLGPARTTPPALRPPPDLAPPPVPAPSDVTAASRSPAGP